VAGLALPTGAVGSWRWSPPVPVARGSVAWPYRDRKRSQTLYGKRGFVRAVTQGRVRASGWVAHCCLAYLFSEIDLIDPLAHFAERAAETLKADNFKTRVFVSGGQDWTPDVDCDAFWVQWALMYMTDDDKRVFLGRCAASLRPGGLIFVKDNIANAALDSKREEAQFFVEDCGICRAYCHHMELFASAGLRVVEAVIQQGRPEGLLPLYTFVLSRRYDQGCRIAFSRVAVCLQPASRLLAVCLQHRKRLLTA